MIEHTLYICREVKIYRIPPRAGATGYRSGDWKVGDNIFTGRLRAVARGELCEIRLEDPSTGDLFAICPVPFGKREIAVEPVTDSSRYYVLRVEDPTTKRHAFLGLGFTERGDAFDFSAALSDHDKHVQQERASKAAALSGGSSVPAAGMGPASVADEAVASLYKSHGDLSLKEGQTIRINVKKQDNKGVGLLIGGDKSKLLPLAPPPGGPALPKLVPPPAPAPAAAIGSWAPPPPASTTGSLLDFDDLVSTTSTKMQNIQPFQSPASTVSSTATIATSLENWATFD